MTGNCELCGRWCSLERHHVYGAANRKRSEYYGYVVNLCHDCHNEPPNGVHHNAKNMLRLHQIYQAEFEKSRSREEFMQEFGKNYL